jgi:transcriptional regulator with XRE-family HTH domain
MICENVERIREAKGIKKKFIASKLGLSLQGYSNMIKSGRIDSERLRLTATVLGEEPAIFFDDQLTKSVINKMNTGVQKTGTC